MSQAGNGMGTWNTCEIPPPTLTLLVDNINNVCVFLGLHLEYSLASGHGIANISKFSILGNFFPYLWANSSNKVFYFLLFVVVSSHYLVFDPLQHT